MPSNRSVFFHSCLVLFLLTMSLAAWGGEGGLRVPLSLQEETWSPVKLIAKRSPHTMVRNIRAHHHQHFTRLVLDLDRHIQPAPSDRRTDTKFLLELPNTRILKKALSKTREKKFPVTVHVSRTAQGALVLAIPAKSWKRYKWYSLQKPPRIVLDLYPDSSPQSTTVADPQPSKNTTPKPTVITKRPDTPKKKPLIIVIDPGHGGKDPGALGRKGTLEKDIALKISGHLRDIITKKIQATVFMTRESDVFVTLKDRASFANQHKADLFVSIHVNSHPKKSIKGLELYHFGEASDPRALEVAARENGTPLEDNAPAWQFILADKLHDKKIEDSQEFAWMTKNSLVQYLKQFYKIKDHGVKTAPFFVLRMTTMPAILAEVAFISNPTEEKLLRSATYQKRMAHGIFKGIQAYITPVQTASR